MITPPFLARFTKCEGTDAGEWGAAICEEAGWPVTADNVYTFAGWFAEEGGGGQNNPMNSTEGNYPDTPGSWNVDGVKDYPDPLTGVKETVATLENGRYPNICAAFKAGTGLASPSAGAAAELGTWSGGGYHSIAPVVVPIPVPPTPKEEVMAIAATTDKDGKVHLFQETSDGTVHAVTQASPGGAYGTPFVVLKDGKKP